MNPDPPGTKQPLYHLSYHPLTNQIEVSQFIFKVTERTAVGRSVVVDLVVETFICQFQNKQDRFTTCFKTRGTSPWLFPKGFNVKKISRVLKKEICDVVVK